MRSLCSDRLLVLVPLLAAGLVPVTAAGTDDALMDKLVEKGILTTEEVKTLRAEAAKDFTTAYAAKSGLPDWVSSLKLKGDLRVRAEQLRFDTAALVDRTRFRYRLRFGVVASLRDDFEVGFQLASGDDAKPITNNQTFTGNASKKPVYTDLAYAKWNPLHDGAWSGGVTVGKMENPFSFTEMVFDMDYTPEGAAAQLAYKPGDAHQLKLVGGGFVVNELRASSHDPFLVGAQARWDATWSKAWKSSVGVAALGLGNDETLTTASIPDVNVGNTRGPSTAPLDGFTPLVADASVTWSGGTVPGYPGAFPVKLAVEALDNPAAPSQNTGFSGGVTFGKAGKKGTWEVSYQYRYLESDAWFEEVVDDDFGAVYGTASARGAAGFAGGTNTRGHILKASYSPYDSLTLSFGCYLTELIQRNAGDTSPDGVLRLRFDAVWKF